ncbi:FAD-dependent monooxygenase [Aliiglaciecola sp. CAU 1673]|uniref:FAD-dependent monooxygenase n=1 Tax=Aliiglaciecola sp. CAU 1673 TaxID=3032595 RepID=UPI0023DC50DC|nr:FAD-dependent monooxygenase [Aliiglaciecola sp. CAU 1673]MDF2179368.1 FAD-dependent monooxygenase [Aliiglaciecola sp. CAU 1673]
MTKFDVIIGGGSMVGAAMALGLARRHWQVAVVEPHPVQPFSASQPPDLRVSAISAASETLLDALGAWDAVSAMRLCPYSRLAVWEAPGSRTEFDADKINVSRLGHIIENRILLLGLLEALKACSTVTWFNAAVSQLSVGKPSSLCLSDHQVLEAPLIIGADGGRSKVRELAGIGTSGWQYSQQAMAISVKTQAPQQDITWQEFHPSGPRAFLPLYDGYASLVWYDSADKIRELQSLSPAQLKAAIKTAFPPELVDFEVLDTAAFPLARMHANQYVKNNVVLVGDAAHTINPLAGQGLNLGFKDVACLLNELDGIEAGDSEALGNALKRYERKRRPDNLIMMSAMDAFYLGFSNDIAPLRLARNLALSLAERSGPIKDKVMKYAIGL